MRMQKIKLSAGNHYRDSYLVEECRNLGLAHLLHRMIPVGGSSRLVTGTSSDLQAHHPFV